MTLFFRSPEDTVTSLEVDQSPVDQSPQLTPRSSQAGSPRVAESGSTTPKSSGRSPRVPDETTPLTIPAVTSVSAPGNIGRMTAHQVGHPAANNIDLNIVLSDVAEEDTDLEDGHGSPVYHVFVAFYISALEILLLTYLFTLLSYRIISYLSLIHI